MNQDELVKSLQDEIATRKKDNEALSAELNAGGGVDTESNAQAVRNALLPNVPKYIQNLDTLANFAESESVMLSANKLLVEWVVGQKLGGPIEGADADFKKLMTAITKQDNKDKESTSSKSNVQAMKENPLL